MVVGMTTTEVSSNRRPTDPAPTHEHGWQVESSHPSTLGLVCYVRCPGCGTRRVDLRDQLDTPPAALSVAVGRPPVPG